MARPLTIRPPTAQQLRRIHRYLEAPLQPWQRRRAEALLLLAAGHPAAFIAGLLGVHVNTIYTDLHAFARHGLRCLEPTRRRGAPPRLTPAQIKAIWRLADQPPLALGLPFARWSLAKLRAYLIRRHLVRAISREHLRRVLKKGGSACAGCVANS
jgi:transposase